MMFNVTANNNMKNTPIMLCIDGDDIDTVFWLSMDDTEELIAKLQANIDKLKGVN